MTKRSGSNTRRRAISRPVRLTAEEDQEIRKRAAECGKTVSGFLRAAALGKKVNSLTDDRVLKEVMRLGALQKKLFIDGKRVGDREYAEVLIAITEYHRALLSRLRGLTLSGTKTHVKQRFLPLTPLLMVSDDLWSPVLPA